MLPSRRTYTNPHWNLRLTLRCLQTPCTLGARRTRASPNSAIREAIHPPHLRSAWAGIRQPGSVRQMAIQARHERRQAGAGDRDHPRRRRRKTPVAIGISGCHGAKNGSPTVSRTGLCDPARSLNLVLRLRASSTGNVPIPLDALIQRLFAVWARGCVCGFSRELGVFARNPR